MQGIKHTLLFHKLEKVALGVTMGMWISYFQKIVSFAKFVLVWEMMMVSIQSSITLFVLCWTVYCSDDAGPERGAS